MACQPAIQVRGSYCAPRSKNVAIARPLSIAIPSCTFRKFRASKFQWLLQKTSKEYQCCCDDKRRTNQQNQPVSRPHPSIALWVTPHRK